MNNEKRHIFLIGPSGVGKTSVANRVAQIAGIGVIDLDEVIEKQVGMPIHDYFENHGEASFRDQERQAIEQISQLIEPHVFATGGGSVLDSRNIIEMKRNGQVVYLSALEKDIVKRVLGDKENIRPLLSGDLEHKVHEQFLNRAAIYEMAADITIATTNREIDAVAQAVLRQCARNSGQGADSMSSIVVGDDLLSKISEYVSGYPTVVLITQNSIPQHYADSIVQSFEDANIKVQKIIVAEGEEAKTFASYESVINQMSGSLVTRNSCVVALGGGVVGDLSGFVASTYHRGIDVIQVPTTLLAQVDSSIGGKCGINLAGGKNLVGSFLQPKSIIADISTLSTLPQEDFVSGLGEIVKYALLGNLNVSEAISSNSEKILNRDIEILAPVIRSCMNHKVHIVSLDPYERNGIRATLNLGHTLAHAIETKTGYAIAHGVAVAIGLRFALDLSLALERITESERNERTALIDALNLEREVPAQVKDAQGLVDLMFADKKSDGGLSMILLNSTEPAELVKGLDRSIVEKTLAEFIG